jgi:hypothetical protein
MVAQIGNVVLIDNTFLAAAGKNGGDVVAALELLKKEGRKFAYSDRLFGEFDPSNRVILP